MTVPAELDQTGEKIIVETEWRHKELIKSIPGAKWDKNTEKWYVPTSWSACLALRSTFRDELEIGPRLTEWATREKSQRIDPCNYLREQLDGPGDTSLFGWQRSGIQFIKYGKQVLIGDEMGSGKTITAIRGLAEIFLSGENVFPILVICPNSVKSNWEREFIKWWPGIEVSVIKGTATQRRKAFEKPAHVYVINTEAVRSHSRLESYGNTALKKCPAHGGEDEKVTERMCQVHPKELNAFKFGAVILDEAHRIKDPTSQQTRAVWGAAGDAPFRIALTGTPIANDVSDLWPILHFLSPTEWPAKTKWLDRFVDTMLGTFNNLMIIGIKPQMHDEFYATLNPRFRRMPEEVILKNLPPIVYERRNCEMSAKQAKAYKQMKEDMIAELETGKLTLGKGGAMTKSLRLVQFASSYAEVETWEEIDDEGFPHQRQKVTLVGPSCKVDTFMDSISDFGSHQVAVVSVSKQLLMLLSAALDKKKIPHGLITGDQSEDERQWAIDNFQAGRMQFILFTAGAGGTGITLTAARYLARLQRPYSLIEDRQVLKRVKRIGSEHHDKIIVVDFVTEGTIDEDVVEALGDKGISFEEVVRDEEALLRLLKDEDR